MKKVLNGLKNKKILIGVGIGLIVLVVIILAIVLLNKGTNQKELENTLTEMGRDFYENYYYEVAGKTDEEKKSLLSKYTTLGIKINLDNLSRYNSSVNKEKIEKFVNSKTKETCDLENTKVIIYPKEKFGVKDYDIKIELVCGFEK